MNVGDKVTVYHTVSDGATATTTEGHIVSWNEEWVVVKKRAENYAGYWVDTAIPLLRVARVVSEPYANGKGTY